jgi:hypothetical protein
VAGSSNTGRGWRQRPDPDADGLAWLRRLEKSLFGDTHPYGEEGVRFYARQETVMQRWPCAPQLHDHADAGAHRYS